MKKRSHKYTIPLATPAPQPVGTQISHCNISLEAAKNKMTELKLNAIHELATALIVQAEALRTLAQTLVPPVDNRVAIKIGS